MKTTMTTQKSFRYDDDDDEKKNDDDFNVPAPRNSSSATAVFLKQSSKECQSFLEEKKTRRRSGEKNLIVCTNNCELSKLHTLSIYILYIQKRSISSFASAIPRLLFGSLTNREDKTVANCASYPGPPSVLEKDNGFFASSSSSSRNIL